MENFLLQKESFGLTEEMESIVRTNHRSIFRAGLKHLALQAKAAALLDDDDDNNGDEDYEDGVGEDEDEE